MNESRGQVNLAEFFKTNFPAANLTIVRDKQKNGQTVDDETKSGNLRDFFNFKFPSIANDNITVLFLLSHGEAKPSENHSSDSDLLIMASDTPKGDPFHSKTLSLTHDIIGRLTDLKPGSFIVGYIDTCQAAAAHSVPLATMAAIAGERGTKMNIWAASLADEYAFQASFTRALVELWQKPADSPPSNGVPRCTDTTWSPSKIRDEISELLSKQNPPLSLKENEGLPTLLLQSAPTLLCLETFAADSAIVTVSNESDATIHVVLTPEADPKSAPQFRTAVDKDSAAVMRVTRIPYDLRVISEDNSLIYHDRWDLAAKTIQSYDVPGEHPDDHLTAMNLERGADAGESLGADPRDVGAFRQLAMGTYEIAKDDKNADRVARLMGALNHPPDSK